jgi:hypothetical protein
MHICPYRAMAIFILNKISLLEPKTQNRVRSAIKLFEQLKKHGELRIHSVFCTKLSL